MARAKTRYAPTAPIISTTLVFALLSGCVQTLELSRVRPQGASHEYRTIDGIEYHVEITGEGPPVVLLHGFGGSTFSWRRIAPELAKTHRVVAVDLVGFGYTERPEERAPYRRDEQIRRLVRLLEALGEDSAHWVGHSYGGGLALALAARYPERVRSLALIDSVGPNHSIERRTGIARATPLAFAYVRGLGLRHRFVAEVLQNTVYDGSQITPEIVEGYRDRLRIEGAVRAFRFLSSGPIDGERVEIGLDEVVAPTLALWGEHDPLMPVSVGHQGVAAIPNAEPLVVIESAGHSPMEERPTAVLAHLAPFLAAH